MDLYPDYSASSLLARMPAPERRFLASIACEARLDAGATLFDEGGSADRFYVLRSGIVEMTQGRVVPVVVDVLGPGDLVGLSWLREDRRWRWSARAATDIVAAVFPADAVLARCEVDERMRLIVLDEVNAALFDRLDRARSASASAAI